MSEKSNSKSWEDRARLFLKAEIKRADLTYEELAERLKAHGIEENAASIANKLSRGTFAATFFLASLTAIGVSSVNIGEI
jgi:3-mercaptopyruvate sulfurtransferase SseA